MLISRKGIKKIAVFLFILFITGSGSLFFINRHVINKGSGFVRDAQNVPEADAVIVLGAYVFPDGKLSDMLADRVKVGLELYRKGKAPKIIVSGDHGRVEYDEVNSMRKYLQDNGVKREDIFMDHAGFNTYDSLYRARDIFLVKKAIIVTQEFHLIRALYIADKLGLEAYGVKSDVRTYPGIAYNYTREVGSRTKAFLQAGIFRPKPKFLGDTIPMSGDGIMTDDGK